MVVHVKIGDVLTQESRKSDESDFATEHLSTSSEAKGLDENGSRSANCENGDQIRLSPIGDGTKYVRAMMNMYKALLLPCERMYCRSSVLE